MTTVHIKPGLLCVYAHIVSGECIYVGMGTVSRAFTCDKRSAKWRALTRYGYEVTILSWHLDRKVAEDVERETIKDRKPACNLVHNGWVQPAIIGAWGIGRKHSAASKKKMAESQKISWSKTKRRTGTRKPIKPIRCVETGVVYHGLREATRQTGICPANISSCINGHRKTAGGFTFTREGLHV